MTRRIIGSMVGVVFITLLLTGTGTFLLARVARTSDDLADLQRKAIDANELLVAVDGSLNRANAVVARPALAAAAGRLRRQLIGALAVSGIGSGYVSASGEFVGDLPAGVLLADIEPAALQDGAARAGRRDDTLWAVAASTERLRSGREVVVVTVLTRPREPLLGPTFRWFLVSAAAAMAIGGLASVALGRRLGRPIHAAADATRRIAAGDLTARLDPPDAAADDELSELARSVNAMTDVLQRAKDQERHFLMSVSHDLRTPLTSIRGYAEAIADGAIDDPRSGASVIVTESRRLERLVGDLLDLARIDADRFDLALVPANVVDIVAGTVEGFAPELREAGLELRHSLDRSAPLVALVDVDRLAQIVANLTTNAIAFADSVVRADVRVVGDEVWIAVSDDGPGIPAGAVPHVFDRLYQADNQQLRRGRGTGLGLAIVAELVARMHGRCEVTSAAGAETRFTIRLPRHVP